jgi:hypothetical protein
VVCPACSSVLLFFHPAGTSTLADPVFMGPHWRSEPARALIEIKRLGYKTVLPVRMSRVIDTNGDRMPAINAPPCHAGPGVSPSLRPVIRGTS